MGSLAQKAVSQEWEPELFLTELYELEANHRHESRLKRLLKESKLPVGKQLHQYKFDEIEGITSL
jgi:DNA replication protein DnaC